MFWVESGIALTMPFENEGRVCRGKRALGFLSGTGFANTMSGAIGAAASMPVMDGGIPDMRGMMGALPPGTKTRTDGDVVGGDRGIFRGMPGVGNIR